MLLSKVLFLASSINVNVDANAVFLAAAFLIWGSWLVIERKLIGEEFTLKLKQIKFYCRAGVCMVEIGASDENYKLV